MCVPCASPRAKPHHTRHEQRVFTSFADKQQVEAFSELVETIASRYISRFGAAVVRRWRFESWNEPDGQCKRQLTVGIECDSTSFLAYFVGGPANVLIFKIDQSKVKNNLTKTFFYRTLASPGCVPPTRA